MLADVKIVYYPETGVIEDQSDEYVKATLGCFMYESTIIQSGVYQFYNKMGRGTWWFAKDEDIPPEFKLHLLLLGIHI